MLYSHTVFHERSIFHVNRRLPPSSADAGSCIYRPLCRAHRGVRLDYRPRRGTLYHADFRDLRSPLCSGRPAGHLGRGGLPSAGLCRAACVFRISGRARNPAGYHGRLYSGLFRHGGSVLADNCLLGEKLPVSILAMVLGLLVCYTFGTIWFMVLYARNSGPIGLATALGWCVFPFVIPDLAKLALAALLARRVSRFLR